MAVVFSSNTPQALIIPDTQKSATVSHETTGAYNTGSGENTLLLNTLYDPSGLGLLLISNQVTVPAGSWSAIINLRTTVTNRCEAYLYNESAASIVEPHTRRVYAGTSASDSVSLYGTIPLTLLVPTTFTLRVYNETAISAETNNASAFGGNSGVTQPFSVTFVKHPV